MTLGWILLVLAVVFVGGMALLQWRLGKVARAREGTSVGDLPAPWDDLARGDALWWFHSPTCGPCRAMKPAVHELAERGRLHEVDVSEHLEVARALSVMATPTTVHVRGGRIVAVRLGLLSLEELEALAG